MRPRVYTTAVKMTNNCLDAFSCNDFVQRLKYGKGREQDQPAYKDTVYMRMQSSHTLIPILITQSCVM